MLNSHSVGSLELIPSGLKQRLLAYARAQSPNEACGLVYRDGSNQLKLHSCCNVSPQPFDAFTIDCKDYAAVSDLGTIEYIFHSHTFANAVNGKIDFSLADRQACKTFGVPWLLLVLPQQEFKTLDPKDVSIPLLGREWLWGISDCYSLIRDALAQGGIYLNDYSRGELEIRDEYIWNVDSTWTPYTDYFEQEGFVEISPHWQLQKYDLLLMSTESRFDNINHAGIMMEPNQNQFYHHLLGRLSEAAVWGGYWAKVTRKIIRHRTLLRAGSPSA